MKKKIEILAPAKDLIQGIAAINSGADAVYIGAPLYGARSNACLLYTSPSPRDRTRSRMPSSA